MSRGIATYAKDADELLELEEKLIRQIGTVDEGYNVLYGRKAQ